MNVETISMKKEEALSKLEEFTKTRRLTLTQEQRLLKKLYRNLAQGKRILDIFETFKQPGAFLKDGYPAIAIGRINWGRVAVEFTRWADQSMDFTKSTGSWRDQSTMKFNIHIPGSCLPPRPEGTARPTTKLQTLIPTVPIEKQPANPNIDDYPYYVLFEVEKWELRAPKDPYLLRRVTPNLFVIEAKWATTKLERAFINGRLVAR